MIIKGFLSDEINDIPMKVEWSLVEECVVLPHKLTTNALRGGGFHDHCTPANNPEIFELFQILLVLKSRQII